MTAEQALKKVGSFLAGHYDVLVIGAGHAGCESALSAAQLGHKTVLFTLHLDSVANLPCNPSIGGTAKGQLVREIDALGGRMGNVADACAIQTRMLNRSKGAAVFSPRAQIDRNSYSRMMKSILENENNLELKQAEVVSLLVADEDGRTCVCGAVTRTGAVYLASAIVVCSGTYMSSRIIMGEVAYESGPDGLFPSLGLSESLAHLGHKIQRFKTGTPVRLNARNVDFSQMEIQPGEPDMPPFSFENEMTGFRHSDRQKPCWTIWTTSETKEIVTDNIHRSPLFSGSIEGTGPRYCPSIEDKYVKFKGKDRHQIFVEPMGDDTCELYLQGFSTSMPEDVQIKMVKSLPGLKDVAIQRSAYAIEYDCIDPTDLYLNLESKHVAGLFCAGQINGSSGYEEAAAQGLIAGINASHYICGESAFILDRSEAYIGVLIDDLVTKGTQEPYRMMTSRAEYRLFLRQDNADIRLTPYGYEIGLISDDRYMRYLKKREAIEKEQGRLEKTRLTPSEALSELLLKKGSSPPSSGVSLADLIRRPQVKYDDLKKLDIERPQLDRQIVFSVEVNIKYAGYLKLERDRIEKFKTMEKKRLPLDLPYESIDGLRIEARQKLAQHRPLSLGQASRISGVSPADVAVLLVYLDAQKRRATD